MRPRSAAGTVGHQTPTCRRGATHGREGWMGINAHSSSKVMYRSFRPLPLKRDGKNRWCGRNSPLGIHHMSGHRPIASASSALGACRLVCDSVLKFHVLQTTALTTSIATKMPRRWPKLARGWMRPWHFPRKTCGQEAEPGFSATPSSGSQIRRASVPLLLSTVACTTSNLVGILFLVIF